MIHYDIDSRNEYFEGSAETFDEFKGIIDELKKIIDDNSSNFLGYINTDTFKNMCLFISFVKEIGVFIAISNEPNGPTFLSLFNRTTLSEVVDIEVKYGNEIYVSKGLFIPAELAWIGVEEFITNGVKTNKIQWITPKDLPEEGNWIA